jgi:hypothetical protein
VTGRAGFKLLGAILFSSVRITGTGKKRTFTMRKLAGMGAGTTVPAMMIPVRDLSARKKGTGRWVCILLGFFKRAGMSKTG